MHNFTDSFEELDRLFSSIATRQVEITNKAQVPPSIYHFSDYRGLAGILESKTLWLSDIFTMNDPSELSYGFELARSAIETALVGNDSASLPFLRAARDFVKFRSFERIADFLAICFSKDPEDLDQWRSYGDNGKGFCLEFDGKVLDAHFLDPNSFSSLGHTYHIRYDTDDLKQAVEEMIFLAIDVAQRGSHSLEGLLNALTLNICLVSLMFKHSAYKREGEVRFMQASMRSSPHLALKHRMHPFKIIRYAEFDWKVVNKKALKTILIGPAAPPEADRFAADCRALYLGEDHPCRIDRIVIPYRA